MTRSNEFSLFSWSSTIPFCDDVWLGMQARNIALVDMTFLRPMEAHALSEYIEHERTPIDVLMPLSALSQMWIFSLYEFLRTWRERADKLTQLSDDYRKLPPELAIEFTAAASESLNTKRKMLRIGPEMYAAHLERFTDKDFVDEVIAYKAKTESLFRATEALRVTLAKHEVPKTKGLFAEAPGYGRMNYRDGSMYWTIILKDESQMQVDRRALANEFLGMDDDPI